jgi:hypothetical protein
VGNCPVKFGFVLFGKVRNHIQVRRCSVLSGFVESCKVRLGILLIDHIEIIIFHFIFPAGSSAVCRCSVL